MATSNNLNILKIYDLLSWHFFIPNYQRGYRWTEDQVVSLLNDLTNFTSVPNEKGDGSTWYCLQPMVVKKCSNAIKQEHKLDTSKVWYEVIDGQQRLTTIFLIGHYINEMWRGKDKDPEIQIKYQTRERSSAFLADLKVDSNNEVTIDKSNIDFFHISSAYQTINNWIKNNTNPNFEKDGFIKTFLQNTKVISYELSETENDSYSIEVFKRINIGKIPLTNAELIKALFLNSSNFKKTETQLRQLEIANEWDRIEYTLQDKEFWYFINKKERELSTKIEYILDLIAKKPEDAKEHHTFEYFNEKFTNKTIDELNTNWEDIKTYFQKLEDWFHNRELYHKVGFLITIGEQINELLDLSNNSTKSNFIKILDEKISTSVNIQLLDIEYGKKSDLTRRLLLLHNIQTMLNNKKENSKFPFDRFKEESWDIEHINAVAEEMPVSEKHQQEWLREASEFITDDKLSKKAKTYNKDHFEDLYKKIIEHFEEKHTDDIKNSIGNLVLLDSGTNRSYKNAVFPVKRNTIIENDKKGTFIPICTKNVFMKLYTDKVAQMSFWGNMDETNYMNDIAIVLEKYLPVQQKPTIINGN